MDRARFSIASQQRPLSFRSFTKRTLAQVLRQLVRRIDRVARMGGEEFCIILTGTQLSEAQEIGERLRHACETETVVVEETRIRFTISVGIAQLRLQPLVRGVVVGGVVVARADLRQRAPDVEVRLLHLGREVSGPETRHRNKHHQDPITNQQ